VNKLSKKIIICVGLFLPFFLYAADTLEYKLAAPIPGGGDTAKDFTEYIKYLFPFLLSFAAIAALVMFIFGGIQYAASGGSADGVKRGREYMTNAILGLLLAVFSALILQTINPQLILLKLDLPNVGGGVLTDQRGCPLDSDGHIPCGGSCIDNSFNTCGAGLECIATNGADYSCVPKKRPTPGQETQPTACTQAELDECKTECKKNKDPSMCTDITCVAIITMGKRAPTCQ
jgi:hypothetical protein